MKKMGSLKSGWVRRFTVWIPVAAFATWTCFPDLQPTLVAAPVLRVLPLAVLVALPFVAIISVVRACNRPQRVAELLTALTGIFVSIWIGSYRSNFGYRSWPNPPLITMGLNVCRELKSWEVVALSGHIGARYSYGWSSGADEVQRASGVFWYKAPPSANLLHMFTLVDPKESRVELFGFIFRTYKNPLPPDPKLYMNLVSYHFLIPIWPFALATSVFAGLFGFRAWQNHRTQLLAFPVTMDTVNGRADARE